MIKTLVFLETSFPVIEAKKILPVADFMPSIKKGDVIHAIKSNYQRIVIIDGNFGWTPSVWHKEILIALDYGIEVFGSSSMGAIRAAELDVYGMQGAGMVYSMYKNATIEGDDEVAVAFSPFINQQTIPLVNIRVTLEKINLHAKDQILLLIQGIFYAERTWDKIAEVVSKKIMQEIQLNYVDVKKEDAIALLNHVRKKAMPLNENFPNTNRQFTYFEKNLIQSVFNPVIFERINIPYEGNYQQLLRGKNLMKLLSISITRDNLLYYQSIIHLIDKQKYTITETEFMEQLYFFREERALFSGNIFKDWLVQKRLFNTELEKIIMDYIRVNKYLLMFFNYNSYLHSNNTKI